MLLIVFSFMQMAHILYVTVGQDSSFAGNKVAQGNQDGNGIGDFYYDTTYRLLSFMYKEHGRTVAVTPSEAFNSLYFILVHGNDNQSCKWSLDFNQIGLWIKGIQQQQCNQSFAHDSGTRTADGTNLAGS